MFLERGKLMFNYSDLNDVEFEYLCQDVMQRMLNTKLRRFAAGKDGGIDLTNNIVTKDIVVQIKHYVKTNVSGLISSLKKEIEKVDELKPEQYYICCSKELTPQKVKEIYIMFSAYMASDKNIVTLIEIDDFLSKSENIDIVRKHYKLWLLSTNILEDIYNNDIFLDCEVLLSTIQSDKRFFVQTQAYDKALECLSKNKILLIVGDPGVGKTITSKMIVLFYATQGYRVRYTTNGTDLSSLKKSLSLNRDLKEIILLDDCLGQAYFNMKETQENELLSLIKYVNFSVNKLLVLNSRVTIFQEAKVKNLELVKSFKNKEFTVHIINMSEMSPLEKAKILYNHLYFNDIAEEYFAQIKCDKNYIKIITHPNFNPRIIEFVCLKYQYEEIVPTEYFRFVKSNLDYPEKVWDNEYTYRLEQGDRILLNTLYSLTDTTVNYNLLKECFNHRISAEKGLDKTLNHFQQSLLRLNGSLMKLVDEEEIKKVSVVNPSVNDYLNMRMVNNPIEKEEIKKSIISIPQFKRLYDEKTYKLRINEHVENLSILDFAFESECQRCAYITFQICETQILNERYKPIIQSYLEEIDDIDNYEKTKISLVNTLRKLTVNPIYDFYNVSEIISDPSILNSMLERLDLADLVEVINACYNSFLMLSSLHDIFLSICGEALKEAISCYCTDVDAIEISGDFDIGQIIRDCSQVVTYSYDDYGEEPDLEEATEKLEQMIELAINDEIYDYLEKLPEKVRSTIATDKNISVSVSGAYSYIESYLCSNDDDDDSYHISTHADDYSEIDLLFNR